MSAYTGTRAAFRAEAASHWWLPAAAVAIAIAAAQLLAPYPPLQDFTEWVYQGEILARLARGLPTPEVALVHHPVPNSLAQAILGLLALAMPASLAGRAFALGLLGAGLALALALARRAQPAAAGAFAVVLIVSFVCNTTFWNGYVNYQLGLMLFGAWLLLPAGRRGETGPILAFSLLIFLSHAAVFAAFGLLVMVEALADRRLRAAVLGLAPAVALGIWYVLAGAEQDQLTHSLGGLTRLLVYKTYTLTKIGPYHNFVFAGGGDETLRPALYWGGALVNLLYAVAILGALAFGLWRVARRRSASLAPIVAALLLVGLFVMLPSMVRGVVNPGERLLIPALLILLLAVPLPVLPLRLAAGLGGLVLAANLLDFTLPARDWHVPVHFRDMDAAGGATTLFRHRPTSFACKWAELRHSEATGTPPRLPISFKTSLLRTDTPDFFCPVPGKDERRVADERERRGA